jgi:hypothetical protein
MTKAFNDMHLIAALLSYGFQPSDIDTTDRTRQRYRFPSDVKKSVWLIDNGKVVSTEIDVSDVEEAYSTEKLMFLPNYPNVLRRTKYAIISKKHEDNDD